MTANAKAPVAIGLEGVIAAETRLSDVDGEGGRLIIAGYPVEELAGHISFEAACSLLWSGKTPDSTQVETTRRAIATGRTQAYELLPRIGDAMQQSDGMEALRAALAHLRAAEIASELQSVALTGASAVFAAAWIRTRAGEAPVAPDLSSGHAADYLRMALGRPPPREAVQALDTYLVTVIDHGMNASTFAARVVASTGSDLVSAVVAAVGTLKGPLHGGAPGPVLEMLERIGHPSNARSWLEAELAAGRRIMGMGHRIYRVRDPRAAVLEKAIEKLANAGLATERLQLARSVEKEAERLLEARHPGRALKANVEFYTSVLLNAVGLPTAAFSPTFAVGRVAGWCAHFAEQQATGRLIRPASRYIGQKPTFSAG